MKVSVNVSVERNHLRLLEYFAHEQNVPRTEIIRRAVRSYINSQANDIELEKEIEKVEKLAEKWEEAWQVLWKKCEAERNLAELENKRREAQIWKATPTVEADSS